MFIRKSKLKIALMWAMIPLMVFGSLPRIGCICANGQHKFFCQRHLTGAHDAQCTCCYGRPTASSERAGKTRGCPTDVLTCCGAKRVSRHGESPAFGTDCPCRPVVDRAVVIAPVKAMLDLDQADHTPLVLAVAPIFALVPGVSVNHARGDLPPPPDLITTLGVLLI
jgi:hypothetical protein